MDQKQPKTGEEFMALPVRPRISIKRVQEVRPDGTTVERPLLMPFYAIAYEADTLFLCCGYLLGLDEEGFFRYEAPFW